MEGLGTIPGSGLSFREEYRGFRQRWKRFEVPLIQSREEKACRCGDILKGRIDLRGAHLLRSPHRTTVGIPPTAHAGNPAPPTTYAADGGIRWWNSAVVKRVLGLAARPPRPENPGVFDAKSVFVINLMSSPGAGKTTLVEKDHQHKRGGGMHRIGVIEGDIQDTYDADRVAALDIPVVQINTGGGCHISANMVREAMAGLDLDAMDFLINENVGNLVPGGVQDRGERQGHDPLHPGSADKPSKYPLMFHESKVLLINKMDSLAPYVDFDLEKARRDALAINPDLVIFEVSLEPGKGLQEWFTWISSSQIEDYQKSRM